MTYFVTENRQKWIDGFLDGDDTVLRVLAMSWLDAQQHRSVQQNAGQRLAPIEKAIAEYQSKCCGMATTY